MRSWSKKETCNLIKISVSILTCDFSRLYEQIKQAEEAGVDMLHLDIMDGNFVPNITMGPGVARSLRKKIKLPFDVHLMINNPLDYIEAFSDVSDILTVHTEAAGDIPAILKKIKSYNIKAGLAINPDTEITAVTQYLEELDMVTVMSVHPGFGGQKLIDSVLPKIKQLRQIADKKGLKPDIEVDGGIGPDNISAVVSSGANIIVAGAAIFNDKTDVKNAVKILRDKIK
jgi:ribulose-phosphate 3-epimerase